VAIADGGTRLAVAGGDGPVWSEHEDGAGLDAWGSADQETWVYALELSGDGRWLASGGESGVLTVRDMRTGRETTAIERHAGSIASIAWQIVPLEIVTPPIPLDRLDEVDDLVAALRDAGAHGTDHCGRAREESAPSNIYAITTHD